MDPGRGEAHTDPAVETPDSGALLDLVFPGFGVFAESARQHWGLDLGRYVHFALGIGIVLYAWSQVRDIVLGSLKTLLFSTAEIRPDDEIYVRLHPALPLPCRASWPPAPN